VIRDCIGDPDGPGRPPCGQHKARQAWQRLWGREWDGDSTLPSEGIAIKSILCTPECDWEQANTLTLMRAPPPPTTTSEGDDDTTKWM
jgi:hypothetical protein